MFLPAFPGFANLICIIFIDSNMHGYYMFCNRASICQALFRGSIQSCNWHNHAMSNILWMYGDINNPFSLNPLIMAANCHEHQHKQRDQNDNDPGALKEFCSSDYQANNQRCK